MNTLHSLAVLLLLVFSTYCYGNAPAEPRFDYWSVVDRIESFDEDIAEQSAAYLASLRALPSLTPYEAQVLDVLETQLLLFNLGPWSPGVADALTTAQQSLALMAANLDGTLDPEVCAVLREVLYKRNLNDLGRSANQMERLDQLEAALAYWEASTDIGRARQRYMALVLGMTLPSSYHSDSDDANVVAQRSRSILRAALKIADSPAVEAQLHFMLAQSCIVATGSGSLPETLVEEKGRHLQAALALAQPEASYAYDLVIKALDYLDYQAIPEPDYTAALDFADRLLNSRQALDKYQAKHLRNRVGVIIWPHVAMSVPNVIYPNQKISLTVSCRNVTAISMQIDSLSESYYLAKTVEAPIGGPREDPTEVWKQTASVPSVGFRKTSAILQIPPDIVPGFYRLTLEGKEGGKQVSYFMVSRNAVSMRAADNKYLVYVCDSATGAPVAGADVSLLFYATEPSMFELGRLTAKTGPDGVAWFNPEPVSYTSRPEAIILVHGAQPAVCKGTVLDRNNAVRSSTLDAFIITDRPMYRPGETVNWKAVVRESQGFSLTNPAEGTQFRIVVKDANYDEAFTATAESDSYGTVGGSFSIPVGARLGGWHIILHQGDGDRYMDSMGFTVEEYRLPVFFAEVELEPGPYRMGDVIEGKVRVNYYSGEPLAGAKVSISVTETSAPLSWGDRRNFVYRPARKVEALQLTTTGDGQAAFSFETSVAEDMCLNYTVYAVVSDLAHRTANVSEHLSVYAHEHQVHLLPESTIVDSGTPALIHIYSETAQEEPAAVKGTLKILRRSEEAGCDRIQLLPVQEIAAQTDAEGNGTVALPVLEDGIYELDWEAPHIEVAESRLLFVGAPSQSAGWKGFGLLAGERFRVNDDGKPDCATAFPAGASVPVLIAAPGGQRYALLLVVAPRIEQVRLVELKGPFTRVDITVPEGSVTSYQLSAFGFVNGSSFESRGDTIKVEHGLHVLDVAVESATEVTGPGESQSLTVDVRDGQTPAAGVAVAVTVFDEALLSFVRDDESSRLSPMAFINYDSIYWWSDVLTAASASTAISMSNEGVPDGEEVFILSPFMVDASEDIGYLAHYQLYGSSLSMSASMEVEGTFMRDKIDRTDVRYSGGFSFPDRGKLAPVRLRRDFRKHAFWTGAAITDSEGRASVTFTVPDGLTAWRAEAYAIGNGPALGEGRGSFRTTVPLAGRLQTPRFLVAGDEAELSVVATNNGDKPLNVVLTMDVPRDLADKTKERKKRIAPGNSERGDWKVRARVPGRFTVSASATSVVYSDGMVMPLEVIEHGIDQQVTRSGTLKGGEASVELDLPREHRPGSVKLGIAAEAGIAPLMLRAMPYLIDYPYSCAEQTTSRVVPAALLLQRLVDQGVDEADVLQAMGLKDRTAYDSMLAKARQSLEAKFDDNEGAWGWFSSSYVDPYMTAYVVWGLNLLADEDLALIDESSLDEATDYLEEHLGMFSDDPDMQAWILFVLTERSGQLAPEEKVLFGPLVKSRDLSPSSLAWLAMAAAKAEDDARATKLLRRLKNLVTEGKAPGTGLSTAHWGRGDRSYYGWNDHHVEATAWALMALHRLEPESPLIDAAINWLSAERTTGRWESTRSTCIVLMALEEVRQELEDPDQEAEVEIMLNGKRLDLARMTGSSLASLTVEIDVPADKVETGRNTVQLSSNAEQPIYFSATLTYFDKQEPIPPSESGVRVERSYHRITETPTLAAGPRLDYSTMEDGDSVTVGDIIEVRVVVTTATDLAYIVLEDYKPAGFEAVEVNSGVGKPALELVAAAPFAQAEYSGREAWLYVEPHDKLRAAFADDLPQGIWEIRYQLRAETPGKFHAQPAKVEAMYSPKTRGTSAENLIEIERDPNVR